MGGGEDAQLAKALALSKQGVSHLQSLLRATRLRYGSTLNIICLCWLCFQRICQCVYQARMIKQCGEKVSCSVPFMYRNNMQNTQNHQTPSALLKNPAAEYEQEQRGRGGARSTPTAVAPGMRSDAELARREQADLEAAIALSKASAVDEQVRTAADENVPWWEVCVVLFRTGSFERMCLLCLLFGGVI